MPSLPRDFRARTEVIAPTIDATMITVVCHPGERLMSDLSPQIHPGILPHALTFKRITQSLVIKSSAVNTHCLQAASTQQQVPFELEFAAPMFWRSFTKTVILSGSDEEELE
jgi:hypothetical protein